MNLYSINIPIIATAYILAEDENQALHIANRDLTNTGLEFSSRHQSVGNNVCIDGQPYTGLYDNEEEIALSPAMSLNRARYRLDEIEEVEIDLEQDND